MNKSKMVQSTLFSHSRSVYKYAIRDNVICITDTFEGQSVTKDADKIIRDLQAEGLLKGRRVIFRDAFGIWDEILVHGGEFTGFRPINEVDRSRAIAKVRSRE
jgi:hypothetical protein